MAAWRRCASRLVGLGLRRRNEPVENDRDWSQSVECKADTGVPWRFERESVVKKGRFSG